MSELRSNAGAAAGAGLACLTGEALLDDVGVVAAAGLDGVDFCDGLAAAAPCLEKNEVMRP